uniref:uncharacterized protein LOC124069826 isoform X2 n=1 Tax=Scatophagus argus TaxID=75038 RepID=UPI001ED85397|nr:uncharacterized protein LOC124069826 isoform X2 [Scatophagus argus]
MMRFILDCLRTPRAANPKDEGDTDVVETDERVLTKAAEIRELENAVAVENVELQEQQSDRKELEETLVKLEKHKEKLVQQIKAIRQLCYEESQQILSLQADEMQKEIQVEEYERELARARWRLRKLREEVKQAKKKVQEAGERNTPLQDSIRQSYEEILQEEHTLCSLSGGAVTPAESQLEESTSPADTTEDDPLPMKPWGRSQSLPAYADLIMRASGSSFCNNLADTREELNNSETSSPKMDRSDIEDDPEEGEINKDEDGATEKEDSFTNTNPLSQLDFFQADPFAHCQSVHDLFNEDMFPKTDSSDGFASDPFKGSNPFAADILFPEVNVGTDEGAGNVGDEADTSLSCAENKASTGTQCFESEFPDEDSDIEISYIQEDLDAIAVTDDSCGFKPIQSSSEELGEQPFQGWRSQGQYSVESDPNGYELDLGTVSLSSNVEEHRLGSLVGQANVEAMEGLEQGPSSGLAQPVPVLCEKVLESDWTRDIQQTLSHDGTSNQATELVRNTEEEPGNSSALQNSPHSQNLLIQCDSDENRELSFELSYEPTSQSSFDPYGFKLSPEHSSHTLLDPDEVELSPEPAENDLAFDPEHSSSQPDQLNFDSYGFDITSSQMARDSDPYGFKLSPEEENQEVLDLCVHDNPEVMDLCTYENNEQVEPSDYRNQEDPEPHPQENQEVLELCSYSNEDLLDLCKNGSQEVLEPSNLDKIELLSNENQELLDPCTHENQEVVEPYHNNTIQKLLGHGIYDNQEVLEPCSHGSRELLDFSRPENQEVLDLDNHGNQELLGFVINENQEVLVSGNHENQELLDLCSNADHQLPELGSHDNQMVLDLFGKEVFPEANNNQCIVEPGLNVSPTSNSSDSDVTSEDLLGLKLDTSICTSNKTNTNTADTLSMNVSNMSANQDLATSNSSTTRSLLEGDLGSVFGAGGYISCPDVADDLEPLDRTQANPVAEPVRPVRPVRPPRPSLRAKEKAQTQTQGIDLK